MASILYNLAAPAAFSDTLVCSSGSYKNNCWLPFSRIPTCIPHHLLHLDDNSVLQICGSCVIFGACIPGLGISAQG
ncbi:hypothetical protein BJX62DRAFT_202171 [Aspergillus germanicus]